MKTMRRDKSELIKGTLDMLILKIVALGPLHGYAISRRIQRISKDVFQLQQGSLYPALHKLEKQKLLRAEWKTSGTGRDAKFYSLTAKGKARLEEEVVNWTRLAEAVFSILGSAH